MCGLSRNLARRGELGRALLSPTRRRSRSMRNPAKYLLAAAVVTSILVVAPLALGAGEGRPLAGGARNPTNDSSKNYTRETQIIADVPTYGTRQSNKSATGGGAIYGCRATVASGRGCVRSSNLADGLAF